MRRKSRKPTNRRVSIEVSRAELAMVVLECLGDTNSLRGQRVTWLQDATSLDSKEGMLELSRALDELVAAEKLAGAAVNVTLSSDFCVTRVLSGETDRLRGELRALRERSNQYLLLGAGRKAVAESSRAIDARHSQAWVTVTNTVVLDHVVQAVTRTGLQVGLIEHEMVSLCRALGRTARDTESPVIIVGVTHRGVDLGICHQGKLLFDYRPGGVDCKGRIAEIVKRHLDRIQRYCDRQFRFSKGEIRHVFLCGPAEEVASIQRQFEVGSGRLDAEVLNARAACPDWQCGAIGSDASYVAAVGAALVEDSELGSGSGKGVPNLMDYFLSANRPHLWPTLIRTAWPVAAVLLFSIGMFGAAAWKHRRAAALERRLAQHETQRDLLRSMKLEAEAATTKLGYLERIKERLMNPAWHEVLGMIGQSKPEFVWLDSLRVDQEGSLTIAGPALAEELIFDFVRYLKQVPVLENVNLEGLTTVHLPERGQVFKFDIKCKFNGHSSLVERTASND